MSLIHLHLNDGSDLYLNPEHIIAILEFQGGTKITTVECRDEQFWIVQEPLLDVVHSMVAVDRLANRVVVPA